MIQRIQTVYLLLSAVAIILAIFMPVGFIYTTNGVEAPLHLYESYWGLLGILSIAAIINIGTIFLFKNRILQIRFCSFNSLILLGFYIAAVTFYIMMDTTLFSFRINWTLCLPAISIILNILAIRGIAKDEALVRAANRIR
ncbi:MAG: DUF4293 domain-containing protein [Bacteroides sp.]|nr:DUF4293 domain-containing protein [Bacteroides sp.]